MCALNVFRFVILLIKLKNTNKVTEERRRKKKRKNLKKRQKICTLTLKRDAYSLNIDGRMGIEASGSIHVVMLETLCHYFCARMLHCFHESSHSFNLTYDVSCSKNVQLWANYILQLFLKIPNQSLERSKVNIGICRFINTRFVTIGRMECVHQQHIRHMPRWKPFETKIGDETSENERA